VPPGTLTTNHLIKIPPTCQNQNSTNSGTNFKYCWLSRIFLLVTLLTKVVQEQQKTIAELKQEVSNLRKNRVLSAAEREQAKKSR
jgi:hypothetical protein